VQANNLEICQILLQGGANVNCIDQTTGRTPLHFAAEAANSAMIEFLIRSGGILDTADASGLTPIHIASIVDSPDALNAIVKVVGSEVLNLSDVRGLTPLMHACLYGNEGNVRLLLKKKVKRFDSKLIYRVASLLSAHAHPPSGGHSITRC